MNDPEVIMISVPADSQFIALEKAVAAAAKAIRLATKVAAPLRSIGDQIIRAAASVPANLAEGHGRSGRDRLHHWRIAYGSAKEVDCHLRLLVAVGTIDRSLTEEALDGFDQVRAITWRLLHPKP